MKKAVMVFAVLVLFSSVVFAAGAKDYQVTGPVIAVTDTTITVEKGKEKWEITYDKAKMPAVKVGDKVMIKYEMKATSIEVKGADKKEEKKADKPADTKKSGKK